MKVKYPVDVQAQLDIRRYSAVCKDAKKGDAVNFSLSPEEYYKVFEIGVVDGKPVIWLDLVQDTGYIQPWINTKFLTLDDECIEILTLGEDDKSKILYKGFHSKLKNLDLERQILWVNTSIEDGSNLIKLQIWVK